MKAYIDTSSLSWWQVSCRPNIFAKTKHIQSLGEPFLGGGSFTIEWTKRYPNTAVWVSDLYEPLVNFWQHVQTDGKRLRNELVQLKYRHPEPSSAKELFLESKDYLATGDNNFHSSCIILCN